MGRLFVLAGHPHNGRNRGEHILTSMKVLCSNLKEELVELWDVVVPKLLSYLHGTDFGIDYYITYLYSIYQNKTKRAHGTRSIGKTSS